MILSGGIESCSPARGHHVHGQVASGGVDHLVLTGEGKNKMIDPGREGTPMHKARLSSPTWSRTGIVADGLTRAGRR